MKVSLNSKFNEGPFGGGMRFALSLKRYLEEHGVEVCNDLKSNDIDVILLINPFPWISVSPYSYVDAYLYKATHPSTVIVQRINECDERRGTNYMNKFLLRANECSDATIYIASWLKPLLEPQGFNPSKQSYVVHNGADSMIFNRQGKLRWDGKSKLKIVTHHWGGHSFKGHDIYQKLDQLLENEPYKDQFEFTFIGNHPSDASYRNTRVLPPLNGHHLADELKSPHVYLTASRNEPAGMHHIEGALCGLPILFINSGALPEYCTPYGVQFELDNFAEKLIEIREKYDPLCDSLNLYPYTADLMNERYYDILKSCFESTNQYKMATTSPLKRFLFSRWQRSLLHWRQKVQFRWDHVKNTYAESSKH